ncbi:UNVERIFIED_CONTAM: hypothetical protein Q9R71_15310 [Actinomycetes bacterium ARC8]|uniref:hypothetical protein n=1 Tax=Glutamicibacter sp. 0426 TaxID=1913445 RepID=UPI0018E9F88B|nr:hypothetical protein [Glutamicibacter sp. 0426]MDV2978539.1 hypothetical protein [Actinomycetes bacterium ARC8]
MAVLVNPVGLGISLSSLLKNHLPTHKEYRPGSELGAFPAQMRLIRRAPPVGNRAENLFGTLQKYGRKSH